MTEEEIRRRLETIYGGIRGAERRLWPQDRLAEDLHIDSLRGLELLVRVEDEFGVRLVDDPRAGTVTTVGELVSLIAELCQAATATGSGSTDHGDAWDATGQSTGGKAEQ